MLLNLKRSSHVNDLNVVILTLSSVNFHPAEEKHTSGFRRTQTRRESGDTYWTGGAIVMFVSSPRGSTVVFMFPPVLFFVLKGFVVWSDDEVTKQSHALIRINLISIAVIVCYYYCDPAGGVRFRHPNKSSKKWQTLVKGHVEVIKPRWRHQTGPPRNKIQQKWLWSRERRRWSVWGCAAVCRGNRKPSRGKAAEIAPPVWRVTTEWRIETQLTVYCIYLFIYQICS